eukprot:1016622-Pyramimonas_sp.AAC.1
MCIRWAHGMFVKSKELGDALPAIAHIWFREYMGRRSSSHQIKRELCYLMKELSGQIAEMWSCVPNRRVLTLMSLEDGTTFCEASTVESDGSREKKVYVSRRKNY